MPDTKISALTAATAAGTDVLPISRAGANYRVTAAEIAALAPQGTVTSVTGTGTVNGLTLTGTVTGSGNITLGGTLSGINLAAQVTGNLPVGNLNGGSGARGFVTDANATTFNSVVAGGGANGVPVFSDGTNWRIG